MQPELDLRVVGRQEAAARLAGRSRARIASPRGVRTGMFWRLGSVERQPAGGGAGLVEAGVDPPGGGVDAGRQHVHVGGLELLQLAILEDQAGHLVPHGRQLLEDLGVGGRPGLGLLEHRQLELLEEHCRELLRGIEVEGRAGRRGDLALEPAQLPPGRARAWQRAAGRWRCRPTPCRPAPRPAAVQTRPAGAPARDRGVRAPRRRAAQALSRCRRRSRRPPPRPEPRRRGSAPCPLSGQVGEAAHRPAEVLELRASMACERRPGSSTKLASIES